MIFKPMKKEDVLKALEGQEDVLQKALKRHQLYFNSLSCPECGGKVMAIVNAKTPWRVGCDVLPNFLAKCQYCGVEFEPYTGIQLTMPEPPP